MIAADRRLADFSQRLLGAIFARKNEVKSLLASLGCSWVGVGCSCVALGSSWGGLGSLLGRSWAVLGRSWSGLGSSWVACLDDGKRL